MNRKTMLKEGLKMEVNCRKILVVDDNQTIRCAVSQMISRLGYDVIFTEGSEN